MKTKIIKASEEVFPIDKEMSIDVQCDQFLRQVGFEFGAKWAIDKTIEWLRHQKEMVGVSFEEDFYIRLKEAMEEGGEE